MKGEEVEVLGVVLFLMVEEDVAVEVVNGARVAVVVIMAIEN